jgi:FAD/FMN-containing dehydrogenase
MSAATFSTNRNDLKQISSDVLKSLIDRIRGRVIRRDDDGYHSARAVWNGLIDKNPGAIVQCTGVADVMAAVRFANEHDLLISVRGGGHNVAGSCIADDGFTIDLSAMRSVRVDPGRRAALVEGGARLGDLDHETQAFELAAPVGVVSATGVAGLTLHGGMGWLLRKHGLSIDNLLSAEVVTADGRLRKASPSENPDLFWAIRGGGGNFGVVTSFELKLHPIGPKVWMSMPIYPLDRANEVMGKFREYMETAPDELMGIGVFWSAPKAPEVPPEYQGKPVVILLGCYSGPFEKGESAIAPLRGIGRPIADLSGPMPWTEAQKLLDPDYPDGAFYYWKSIYLDRLDDKVVQTISDHAASRPSPISSIDVWALGRGMSRVGNTDTAFYKRDSPYLVAVEANWEDAQETEANIEWARNVFKDFKAYTRGGNYLNFPGFFENREDMLFGAYGPNLKRLKEIKAKYDPSNLFRGAVNISPNPLST